MSPFWKRAGGEAAKPAPPAISLTGSRLLGDLLAGLPRRAVAGGSPRVLLAGPPSGPTIETFHGVGCKVTVAGDDEPERLGLPDRSVDLVLGFDQLDLLDTDRARGTALEWARLIRPSGGLYLLARRDATVYPPPWRVEVLPDATMRLIPQPDMAVPTVRPRTNRELEEIVRPLQLRDIFLRRDGLREIICRRV
jgi:hypothetical protein